MAARLVSLLALLLCGCALVAGQALRSQTELLDCCKKANEDMKNATQKIACPASADVPVEEFKIDTSSATPELGYHFFFKCVTKNEDQTKCCQDNGVPAECQPFCNGKSLPVYADMANALKEGGKCEKHKVVILQKCLPAPRVRGFNGKYPNIFIGNTCCFPGCAGYGKK